MREPLVFSSKRSFIDHYVRPALGEHADEFYLDNLADEMLEHYTPPRGVDPAWRDANRTGFIERQDVDFWEIMRRNDKTLAPAATGARGDEQIPNHSNHALYPTKVI